MDDTLCALLLGCNHDPKDTTAQRVAADRADECDLPGLAWLLRAMSYAELDWRPTGSRVYGTPRPDSDFDWVIEGLASSVATYKKYADAVQPDTTPSITRAGGTITTGYGSIVGPSRTVFGLAATFRFGPVNLLVCDARNPWQWDSWVAGTAALKSQAAIDGPRTREQAVEMFQAHFRARM